MNTVSQEHIERTSGVCGGKPCVRGTRIRVWDVYVAHELAGQSAEQILADYPSLTLPDVYAALAYYWDHQAEIDAEMKAADEFVEQLRQTLGPGPLAEKLAKLDQ